MLATAAAPGFRSLGQATARTIALHAVARGRLGTAFLVHGPSGAGKGAFVEDLLALILCTAPLDGERPCNACQGCLRARSRSHPDLVVGSPERWRELSGTGESMVAAARRWLGDAAGAPIAGAHRVVLVEGMDRAGEQIQNTLLKALEEPTDRHVFILVATDPRLLLPTVRSRCQPLRIGPVAREELAAWLAKERRMAPGEADLLARLASGFVGRALGLAASPQARAWRTDLQRELLDLLAAGRAARLGRAREILDRATREVRPASEGDGTDGGAVDEPETVRTPAALQRAAASAVAEVWLELARDMLVVAGGHPEAAVSLGTLPELTGSAARVGTRPLSAFIGVLERVHDALAQNGSPRLALDVAMLAWPTVPAS